MPCVCFKVELRICYCHASTNKTSCICPLQHARKILSPEHKTPGHEQRFKQAVAQHNKELLDSYVRNDTFQVVGVSPGQVKEFRKKMLASTALRLEVINKAIEDKTEQATAVRQPPAKRIAPVPVAQGERAAPNIPQPRPVRTPEEHKELVRLASDLYRKDADIKDFVAQNEKNIKYRPYDEVTAELAADAAARSLALQRQQRFAEAEVERMRKMNTGASTDEEEDDSDEDDDCEIVWEAAAPKKQKTAAALPVAEPPPAVLEAVATVQSMAMMGNRSAFDVYESLLAMEQQVAASNDVFKRGYDAAKMLSGMAALCGMDVRAWLEGAAWAPGPSSSGQATMEELDQRYIALTSATVATLAGGAAGGKKRRT